MHHKTLELSFDDKEKSFPKPKKKIDLNKSFTVSTIASRTKERRRKSSIKYRKKHSKKIKYS